MGSDSWVIISAKIKCLSYIFYIVRIIVKTAYLGVVGGVLGYDRLPVRIIVPDDLWHHEYQRL